MTEVGGMLKEEEAEKSSVGQQYDRTCATSKMSTPRRDLTAMVTNFHVAEKL